MGVVGCASVAAGPASAGTAAHITTIVAAVNAAAIDPAILPISSSKSPASRSHYPLCKRLVRRSIVQYRQSPREYSFDGQQARARDGRTDHRNIRFDHAREWALPRDVVVVGRAGLGRAADVHGGGR